MKRRVRNKRRPWERWELVNCVGTIVVCVSLCQCVAQNWSPPDPTNLTLLSNFDNNHGVTVPQDDYHMATTEMPQQPNENQEQQGQQWSSPDDFNWEQLKHGNTSSESRVADQYEMYRQQYMEQHGGGGQYMNWNPEDGQAMAKHMNPEDKIINPWPELQEYLKRQQAGNNTGPPMQEYMTEQNVGDDPWPELDEYLKNPQPSNNERLAMQQYMNQQNLIHNPWPELQEYMKQQQMASNKVTNNQQLKNQQQQSGQGSGSQRPMKNQLKNENQRQDVRQQMDVRKNGSGNGQHQKQSIWPQWIYSQEQGYKGYNRSLSNTQQKQLNDGSRQFNSTDGKNGSMAFDFDYYNYGPNNENQYWNQYYQQLSRESSKNRPDPNDHVNIQYRPKNDNQFGQPDSIFNKSQSFNPYMMNIMSGSQDFEGNYYGNPNIVHNWTEFSTESDSSYQDSPEMYQNYTVPPNYYWYPDDTNYNYSWYFTPQNQSTRTQIISQISTTVKPTMATTTAMPRKSTSTAMPRKAIITAMSRKTTTTAMPLKVTTTARPRKATTTAIPREVTPSAMPRKVTTTARPPKATTTAQAPKATTTAQPPEVTTTTRPPKATTTAQPVKASTTAQPPMATTTAMSPKVTTTTASPPTITPINVPMVEDSQRMDQVFQQQLETIFGTKIPAFQPFQANPQQQQQQQQPEQQNMDLGADPRLQQPQQQNTGLGANPQLQQQQPQQQQTGLGDKPQQPKHQFLNLGYGGRLRRQKVKGFLRAPVNRPSKIKTWRMVIQDRFNTHLDQQRRRKEEEQRAKPVEYGRSVMDSFVESAMLPGAMFAFSMLFMDILGRLMPFSFGSTPTTTTTTTPPPKITKFEFTPPKIPTIVDMMEHFTNKFDAIKAFKMMKKSKKKKKWIDSSEEDGKWRGLPLETTKRSKKRKKKGRSKGSKRTKAPGLSFERLQQLYQKYRPEYLTA